MKIGIITFHFAFNQGAVLQCYAMQRYLESCGHDAYVINYRPRYHTIMHSAWRNPFVYSFVFWKKLKKYGFLMRFYLTGRSFARCMIWNIMGIDKRNANAFRHFCSQHLHLTKVYRSFKELRDDPPQFDAYISGSDQVWNPELLEGEFDKAYFLDFGGSRIRRITYAVSMGERQDQENLLKLQTLCEGIDAISFRECKQEDIKAVGRDVHICIDPTFLLDTEDYGAVESQNIEELPYIFVYGLETNEALKEAVGIFAEKYKCRIINGSPKWVHLNGDVKEISGYGPEQFLTFIKNAKGVVTNSFHGTAFSIIYKKDFITVPHSTRGKRMEDLLAKLGLSYRIYGEEGFSVRKTIDYDIVNEKLERLKEHSKEYLKMALGGNKGEEIPHYPEDEECFDTTDSFGKKVQAYYGYFKDTATLKTCASGGAATALAESILSENGAVFGVAFTEDYKSAVFRCVEKIEDLDSIKGSKYLPPKTNVGGKLIYDIVEEKLSQGKKVLFIGSGCHVATLMRRLKKNSINTERLYTADLICHGPTIQPVYDDFVRCLENRFHSKIVHLNMRFKKKGWVPPYIEAMFANGKKYSKPLYETDFGFALRVCVRESCYHCQFKGDNHIADITIGDYWGIKPGMKEYNKNGVSVMLSRTSKGDSLIMALDKNHFFVDKTDVNQVISHNRMYLTSLKKALYIEKFKKELEQKGLHYAVIHSKGYSDFFWLLIRNRIKQFLRIG